jgi:hypothetical protein
MATYANSMFAPRGFSKPVLKTHPPAWATNSGGLTNSLTIEALASYLASVDAVTYSPDRLANMTANDMRYAQNLILNFLP